MLTTPWKKVLLDLWEHRMRTLIVALAIAVGVYAVGVVLNTREILIREYESDQAGARVPSAILYTQPFDDDLAANLAADGMGGAFSNGPDDDSQQHRGEK